MESKYIIRNQNNLYLCRGEVEWDTGKDASKVVSFPYYDEALNTLIEKSAKDIELRGSVLEVDCDDKGRPLVEVLVESIERDSVGQNDNDTIGDSDVDSDGESGGESGGECGGESDSAQPRNEAEAISS